jgi:hypothetical protein
MPCENVLQYFVGVDQRARLRLPQHVCQQRVTVVVMIALDQLPALSLQLMRHKLEIALAGADHRSALRNTQQEFRVFSLRGQHVVYDGMRTRCANSTRWILHGFSAQKRSPERGFTRLFVLRRSYG